MLHAIPALIFFAELFFSHINSQCEINRTLSMNVKGVISSVVIFKAPKEQNKKSPAFKSAFSKELQCMIKSKGWGVTLVLSADDRVFTYF